MIANLNSSEVDGVSTRAPLPKIDLSRPYPRRLCLQLCISQEVNWARRPHFLRRAHDCGAIRRLTACVIGSSASQLVLRAHSLKTIMRFYMDLLISCQKGFASIERFGTAVVNTVAACASRFSANLSRSQSISFARNGWHDVAADVARKLPSRNLVRPLYGCAHPRYPHYPHRCVNLLSSR